MKKEDVKEQLYAYISSLKIISTHTHILSDEQLKNTDLDFILSQNYLSWLCDPPENTIESRNEYILVNRCNSYFRWLDESLYNLYGLNLTAKNYDELNERIKVAHKDKSFYLEILKKKCGYESAILDKFDSPGSDNGHPEMFKKAFRINMFMGSYNRTIRDYRGVSAYDFIDTNRVKTFDDYIDAVSDEIRSRKKQGVVSLKNATAYERGQIYENTDKSKASRAFDNPNATDEDKKNFSDYMMFTITGLAQELDLPIQIHTGLGNIDHTRAAGLRELIMRFPNVRFDIFHASYPWSSDILAIMHYFKNAYCNLCWLPIISTFAAKNFIKEVLEVSNCHRIFWGCDVRTSEDSYGTVLAMRHVLSDALADLVEDGAFDLEYAKYIAERILYDNPKEFFKI